MNVISNNKLILISLAVFAALSFSSCRFNKSTTDQDAAGSEQEVKAEKIPLVKEIRDYALSGIVKGRDGKPLGNVVVSTGDSILSLTDKDGAFTLTQVEFVNNRSVVHFLKEGYFPALHSGEMRDDEFIEIILQPYGNTDISVQTTFESDKAFSLIAGKMKIDFEPNGLVDANGNTYKGTVFANMLYLDPTTAYFASTMPGSDLAAIRTNGDEAILVSYGMMKTELKDTTGGKLQLKEGITVTATYPIPDAMLKEAPDSIPLWYFNEESGLWEEDGVAYKKGDEYIGKLPHFSWWNVDYPHLRHEINGIVVDCNNEPVSNVKVSVDQTFCYTNSKGEYRVYIPRGWKSTLTIAGKDYFDYDDSVAYCIEATAGGTVETKDLQLPCMPRLKATIKNTCGETVSCKVYCEYKQDGVARNTIPFRARTGEQFSIRLPFNASSVVLHVMSPDGNKIQQPIKFNGKDLLVNDMEICAKKNIAVTDIYFIDNYDDIAVKKNSDFNAEAMSSTNFNVEVLPEFQDGERGLNLYLAQTVRYPKVAQENGIQGQVAVSFIVKADGSITDVEVVKSVDKYLDAEAVRAVQAMPRWTPAQRNGKAVDTKYVIPINFKL